jgi:hypothetical protein
VVGNRFAGVVVPEQNVDDLVVHVLAYRAGRLSFAARGLLIHLMGSGEERHSLTELVEQSGTARGELLRAIRELEDVALVRLADADSTGPRLATVTPHRARPLPPVRATPEESGPADSAVTQAGIALVRDALRAARDRGSAPRRDRRPYVPPWQVPRARRAPEGPDSDEVENAESTEDQGVVGDDVEPEA